MKLLPSVRRILERLSRAVVVRRRLPGNLGETVLDVSPGAALTYWAGMRGPNLDDLHDFARRHISAAPSSGNRCKHGCARIRRGPSSGRTGTGSRLRTGLMVRATPAALSPAESACRRTAPDLAWRCPMRPRCTDSSFRVTAVPPRIWRLRGGAGTAITGGARYQLLVPTVILDRVAESEPAPGIIKIDVDGGEHRVLLGARTLLQTMRPKILIEVYERNADAVGALRQQHGYRLFSYEKGDRDCQPINRPTYNTLALPA